MVAELKVTLPADIELERIVPLAKAAELRGVSVDTLKRREPNRIISRS